MAKLAYSNIVTINLEKAKKNYRIDICCRNFENIENGLIIINEYFATITYFPNAYSDPRVKEHLKYNNFRTFSSMLHCLHNLDKKKRNIIIVAEKSVYLTDIKDCLVSFLFDPKNIYDTVFEFEFDARKNSIKAKTNYNTDIQIRSSWELSENIKQTKDRGSRRKTVRLYRRRSLSTLKPREKKIASIDENSNFLELEPCVCSEVVPVFHVRHDNRPSLITVISSIDNSSLSGEGLSYGEIVPDCAGSNSLGIASTAQQQPSHQIYTGEYAAHHASSSHNNPTYRGQADEAPNTGSIHRVQGQNGQRHQWPKHPRYSTYDARKASYATFREFRNLDIDVFARTGLFHIGEEDIVKCFQCGIELQNWSTDKDPVIDHVKSSPDCSFLADQLGVDTLDEYKALIRSSERRIGGELSSCISSNEEATGDNSVPAFTAVDHIRSPQYQAYSARLSTFARWPPSMTQKPEQVAQAGFYYTGLQDVVRCFACDGGLKNWDPEDDPWIEHARWFSKCPFVRKVKGQEYVDLVRRMTEESDEEEDTMVRSTFQRDNPKADPLNLEQLNLGNHADEPSQLETDAAQIIIQTGYSRKAVAMAIDDLISKGKRQYTAQDIMTVILDKEDRGEHLPLDDDPNPPLISSQTFRSTPSVYKDNDTESDDVDNDTESDDADTDTILKENKSLKSVVTCNKCQLRNRNILFLPCTHHCLCQVCAEKCSLCPICYKIIKQKIKTYMI